MNTTNEGVPPEKIAQAAQHAVALKRAQEQAEAMREARLKALVPRPKLAGLGCAAAVILTIIFASTALSSAVGIALAHRWGW